MKTTNKFDYPTAAAYTYKQAKSDQSNSSLMEAEQQKKRYQDIIKQEKQNQRAKVKQDQEKKKQLEKYQEKNKIKAQIERKKKQLLELDLIKKQALENQKKAHELAVIKEQQEKIRKIQQNQKNKEAEENANERFKDALRRLEVQKQENSYKEKQAQYRRKVNLEKEKQQRQKAIKYQNYLEEKERQEKLKENEEQKKNFDLYRQGLSTHGYSKNIDYTKTCFHNPKIIIKNEQEASYNAYEKGDEEFDKRRQLSREKLERKQQLNKASIQRGEKALQKMKRQKEYSQYCKDSEQQQVTYNLNRIQAGKKNQYTGLKPLTLTQIENNKKVRSQKEFEDMFLKKPYVTFENGPASKYQIYEQKMIENPQETNKYNQWMRNSLISQENQSQIPQVSAGKYQFEERSQISDRKLTKKSVKRGEENEYEQRQLRVEPEIFVKAQNGVPEIIQEYGKTRMQETRLSDGNRHKKVKEEELSYSQSEEDSNI